MFGKSARVAAFGKSARVATAGLGAAALLVAARALPANAASTEGRQTFTYDNCFIDDEMGLVSCFEGSQRSIEVWTPSGVVIIQGESEFSDTTTHRGETTTSSGAHKFVSVFASYIDGLFFEANVIKLDGTSTTTFSDGTTCIFETDFLSGTEDLRYDHGTLTCTAP